MVFECFDGIHDACSVCAVDFWVSGSFRAQGRKVNIWLGRLPDRMGRCGTITLLVPVRSPKIVSLDGLQIAGAVEPAYAMMTPTGMSTKS
jgi:hypothetical protein